MKKMGVRRTVDQIKKKFLRFTIKFEKDGGLMNGRLEKMKNKNDGYLMNSRLEKKCFLNEWQI